MLQRVRQDRGDLACSTCVLEKQERSDGEEVAQVVYARWRHGPLSTILISLVPLSLGVFYRLGSSCHFPEIHSYRIIYRLRKESYIKWQRMCVGA